MAEGIVKNYFRSKGYGFIYLANHPDVFFHYTELEDDYKIPQSGDKVEFELEEVSEGRYKACNVKFVAGRYSEVV